MHDFRIVTEILYSGQWHDISVDVRNRDPAHIERGTPDESGVARPSHLTFTLNNGLSNISGTIGRYSPRNPRSDLYGLIGRNTPVRQSVDGHRRFCGEIAEWPARWNLADTDAWVSVGAYGILRRLGQLGRGGGSKPADSAFKRRLLRVGADAYWPLDSGELSSVGHPLFGDHPFEFLGLFDGNNNLISADRAFSRFDGGDLAPWLGRGMRVGVGLEDKQRRTRFAAPVEMTGAVEWTFEMFHRYSDGPAITELLTSDVITNVAVDGPEDPFLSQQHWTVTLGTSTNPSEGPQIRVAIFIHSTEIVGVATGPNVGGPNNADGELHHLQLRATQNGPDVDWTLTFDGAVLLAGTVTSLTLQNIERVRYNYIGWDDSPPVTIGHLAIRSRAEGELPLSVTPTLDAAAGHLGEPAGQRVQRLCDEERIPITIVGEPEATEPLGEQQIAPFLDLLGHAVAADRGVLYEDRMDCGLVYATLGSLYNRTPMLRLDYAAGHITDLEPTDDDQLVINDVIAKRFDGGERRRTKMTGPLSVEPPPDGVGRYDHQVTLNVTDDDRLTAHAGAHVEQGTFDETRFPEIGISVLKHEQLRDDFAAVDVGDWLTIDNPPPWLPPEQIGCLVRGYTERYSRQDWSVMWNTIPSALFTVGVLDADRLDSDVATVAETFVVGTDTALMVAFPDGAALAATGADDFEVQVAGVRLRVTNISGSASPQTFTVDAEPTNGIRKTLPVGAAVRLAKPLRLAFGGVIVPSGFTPGVLDVDRLDTNYARVETDFVAGTDTSLSVEYMAGLPAATGATSFDVLVGGVILHVTNISGASSPQTFTVDQQPINNVTGTILAGTSVHLARPWRLAA